jgi:hypothetical protein
MPVLNHGLQQPNYYQGKKLANLKKKKKDENT